MTLINKIKKICLILSILSLSIIFVSCKDKTLPYTYDALYESNKIESVLSKHSSISYTFNNLINDTQSYTLYISDKDFSLERKDYVRITIDGNDYYYDKKLKCLDKINNVAYDSFRMQHGSWCIIYEKMGDEEVEVTNLTKDDICLNVYLYGDDAINEIKYLTDRTLIANQYMMYEVILDRETMLVKSFKEYIVNKEDNNKEEIARVENITYDKDVNSYIKDAKAYEKELKKMSDDSFRTLTVVINPGCEEEMFVVKERKDKQGNIFIKEGDEVYLDKEITIPYTYNENDFNDKTIYIKRINKE